jgi:hypothetical protein
MKTEEPRGRTFHPVYLLLAVPFVALLWVPSYNRLDPELFGSPFFYWYQMAWTLLGAACTLPVYLHEERTRQNETGKNGAGK